MISLLRNFLAVIIFSLSLSLIFVFIIFIIFADLIFSSSKNYHLCHKFMFSHSIYLNIFLIIFIIFSLSLSLIFVFIIFIIFADLIFSSSKNEHLCHKIMISHSIYLNIVLTIKFTFIFSIST